jgi:DNA-binding transcriptional LysR family regulator
MAAKERRLNLRQIEVFRAVMMAGSVTAAARTLRISQPAVSRLLRYTEQRLATPLFSRVKGRLHPTAQAQVLYEEVEKVYKGLDSVQDVARTLAENLVGQLRIVASPSLDSALVANGIASLCRQSEHVKIRLQVVPQAELVRQLLTYQADLGLTMTDADHPSIKAHPLAEGGLLCVAPDGHPLSKLALVRPADLRGYALIFCEDGRPREAAIDEGVDDAATAFEAAINVPCGETACMLVEQGAGIALVDEFCVKFRPLGGLISRPFASETRVEISLLHNRARPLSELATCFHQTVKRLASGRATESSPLRVFHNAVL